MACIKKITNHKEWKDFRQNTEIRFEHDIVEYITVDKEMKSFEPQEADFPFIVAEGRCYEGCRRDYWELIIIKPKDFN